MRVKSAPTDHAGATHAAEDNEPVGEAATTMLAHRGKGRARVKGKDAQAGALEEVALAKTKHQEAQRSLTP